MSCILPEETALCISFFLYIHDIAGYSEFKGSDAFNFHKTALELLCGFFYLFIELYNIVWLRCFELTRFKNMDGEPVRLCPRAAVANAQSACFVS